MVSELSSAFWSFLVLLLILSLFLFSHSPPEYLHNNSLTWIFNFCPGQHPTWTSCFAAPLIDEDSYRVFQLDLGEKVSSTFWSVQKEFQQIDLDADEDKKIQGYHLRVNKECFKLRRFRVADIERVGVLLSFFSRGFDCFMPLRSREQEEKSY